MAESTNDAGVLHLDESTNGTTGRKYTPGPTDVHYVETDIMYTKPNESLFAVEKPYMMRYRDLEAPPTNMSIETYAGVKIRDIREMKQRPSLDVQGFDALTYETDMSYDQYDDKDAILNVYLPELAAVLKRQYGAKRIEFVRHGIRKRDKSFPISTGMKWEYDQPSILAHTDISAFRADEQAEQLFADQIEDLPPYEIVNVWKPLRGPLYDWPLAVCDASTMDFERDLISADLVWPDEYFEKCACLWSKHHRWYYIRAQTPNDLLVFRQADSTLKGNVGVIHSSFQNTLAPVDCLPRESIEVQAIMFFDEKVVPLKRTAAYPMTKH